MSRAENTTPAAAKTEPKVVKRVVIGLAFLGANIALVRVGAVFGTSGSAVAEGLVAWLLLTIVWMAADSARQLNREDVLRRELSSHRWQSSEAYSACSCGAYRKDRENHS